MFTGIITDTVKVKDALRTAQGLLLTFEKPTGWDDLQIGESIATDGACLTVAAIRSDEYDCLLVPETLQKTSFGQNLPVKVNLERSLGASERFGGHFVQGHIDTTSKVLEISKGDGWQVRIALPAKFSKLVVSKGSIAINGISLTVADTTNEDFSVALIPHTLKHTTLGALKVNDEVNLEFDMIGKYVVRSLEHAKS